MKKKIIFSLIFIMAASAGFLAWKVFGPTITAPDEKYFYIKSGSSYADVKKSLLDKKIVGSEFFFTQLAEKLNYPKTVKAGRYEIKNGMSLFSLIRMLRAGNQSPVNFVINKLRLKEDLAAKIASNFECDSLSVINYLNNKDSLKKYNLDSNTILSAIIPNTYSISWNTPPSKIFKKLFNDQEKFWTEERKKKAAALNMTPLQVYTMASIVDEETNKDEDKGKVASVYINRIETGMRLEADPTLKFALKDFGLKRVLNVHKEVVSPYNTYKNSGLPPGPICTPSGKTIDAVLNAPQTNYIFFVARPGYSGYSDFASTYAEHMVYAKAYQQWIDTVLRAKAAKAKAAN
jgi:UPF0755 protein